MAGLARSPSVLTQSTFVVIGEREVREIHSQM